MTFSNHPIPTKPKQVKNGGRDTNTKWTHPKTPIPFYRLGKLVNRISELESILGDKPDDWRKPNYGHLDYTIAHQIGWISDKQEKEDRALYEIKRERSLKTCHTSNPGRYDRFKEWSYDFASGSIKVERNKPSHSGAYIPEMNAAILQDQDLTDGAKICLAKILEETYRNNRDDRWLATTVSYLMQALGRSRRTIQNYLMLLEQCGYIAREVIISTKTRMTNGQIIKLNNSCFAKHHKEEWPMRDWQDPSASSQMDDLFDPNSGAQKISPNYFSQIYLYKNIHTLSMREWIEKSTRAIYKRFIANNEPYEQTAIKI